MTRRRGVGLAQRLSPPFDGDANRAASVRDIGEAFARGADIVVLPELTVPGYALDRRRLRELAEPLDGPTVSAWVDAAGDGGLVAGGLCERAGDDIFNSAVLVDADGVLLHYRKLHLFGGEKLVFAPGDLGLPVADTACGRLGLCVCYDLRFVEVVRVLALRDVDMVIVPTAWVGGFDARPVAPGELCGQARGAALQANLNQVFIACASQCGRHDQFRFLGNSLVADPYGQVVAPPLSDEDQTVVVVDIDLDVVAAARRRGALITPRDDRRTDVYGLWYQGEVR